MANPIKITDLPSTSVLSSTDILPVVVGPGGATPVTNKTLVSTLATAVAAVPGILVNSVNGSDGTVVLGSASDVDTFSGSTGGTTAAVVGDLGKVPAIVDVSGGSVYGLPKMDGSLLTGVIATGTANWTTATADPDAGFGTTGDFVLRTDNNTIHYKAGGGWGVALQHATVKTITADTGTFTADDDEDTIDFAGGTGLTSSITSSELKFDLDATDVTAGSYTAADITVDAQGRLTAAASGTIDLGGEISGTLAVADGGTGSANASAARTALGVAIGSNVQAYDADLDSLAGLANADSNFIVGTGAAWAAESGATARTSLGVDAAGTDNSTDVTLANTNYLTIAGQAITGGTVPLGSGGTGATSAGAARTALDVDAAGTDNSTDVTLVTVASNYLSLSAQAITAGTVPLALGGTGATTVGAARTALGVAIGTDVQAYNAALDSVSGTNTGDADVVDDSTPQLGGNLDVNGKTIVSVSNGNITLTPHGTGKVVISSGLEVSGTTTTIDSTTLTVDDKNIELGSVGTPSDTTADGGGITLKGATDKTITWTNSTDTWDFNQSVNVATATDFQIAGTSVLNATTLGTAVVASSLTSVGTITTGVWTGTAIADANISSASTWNALNTNVSTDLSVTASGTGFSVNSSDGTNAALTLADTDNWGVMSDEMFDKLDGVEASADVTDATNVNTAGAVMNSDLDGKGEILIGDGAGDPTALAVGTDDYVLTAASGEATGIKWAEASGGGGASNLTINSTAADYTLSQDDLGEVISFSAAKRLILPATNGTPVEIATNDNPIAITSRGHGLATGDVITVANVEGNTAANGAAQTVTVTDVDTFTLDSSGAGDAPDISDATNAAPIVITTTVDHGLSNDDVVYITGVVGNTNANGTWTIANKNAADFELVGSYGNATYDSGGVWTSGGTWTIDSHSYPEAGFHCTVVNTGTGSVTLAAAGGVDLYNSKSHFFINGRGSAEITSYATDDYTARGDVQPPKGGFYLDVGDDQYFTSDDEDAHVYTDGGTDSMDAADWGNYEYLKITGSKIKGNYSIYSGTDGLANFKTAVDSAFGVSSLTPDPAAWDSMGGSDGFKRYFDGSSTYAIEAIYVYCGTGNTATTSEVRDVQGGVAVTIVPFIYQLKSDVNDTRELWGLSFYYLHNSDGSVGEGYWDNSTSDRTGNSGSFTSWDSYACVEWAGSEGATKKVLMGGIKAAVTDPWAYSSATFAAAWDSDSDLPSGYMHF